MRSHRPVVPRQVARRPERPAQPEQLPKYILATNRCERKSEKAKKRKAPAGLDLPNHRRPALRMSGTAVSAMVHSRHLLPVHHPDGVHVITRGRNTRQRLRTQQLRIMMKAGPQPCEKSFPHRRASAGTDLATAHRLCVSREKGRLKMKPAGLGGGSARLEGFEPPTFGSVGRRSIQLSYRRLRMVKPVTRRPACERCSIEASLPAVNRAGNPGKRQ